MKENWLLEFIINFITSIRQLSFIWAYEIKQKYIFNLVCPATCFWKNVHHAFKIFKGKKTKGPKEGSQPFLKIECVMMPVSPNVYCLWSRRYYPIAYIWSDCRFPWLFVYDRLLSCWLGRGTLIKWAIM